MMVITICILSVALVFFVVLAAFLFYGLTESGGMLEELRRYERDRNEVNNLQTMLVKEKFGFYLPQTERTVTEAVYRHREEIKEQGDEKTR